MEPDFLILAEAAEVIQNKLYMLGGGWTRLNASTFPVIHRLAVAAGILIGSDEAGRHSFAVEVRRDGEGAPVASVAGAFQAGGDTEQPSPPRQRVVLTWDLNVTIDSPGEYMVELHLDGETAKRTQFWAYRR